MSKKNNKRPNKNQSLSKKQRKKLAKRGIKTRAPRRPVDKAVSLLVTLTALVCVMAVVCTTFGGILLARTIGKREAKVSYLSEYEKTNLAKHLTTAAMGKIFYTMNNEVYDKIYAELVAMEAYQPMKPEDMDEYIENLRMEYRELVKGGQKQAVIGKGDDVAIYITDIFNDKGERIPTSVMQLGSYTDSISFTVGTGWFSEPFDEALIALQLKPETTGRELRQNGSVSLSDTVCITYSLYKSASASSTPDAEDPTDRYEWEKKAMVSMDQSRVSLSDAGDIEATLAAALVENMTAIGEKYSFVLDEYNPTGNATDKGVYRVDAAVHFVITEEHTADVTFTIPEDFFVGEDGNDILELNGKEVTFRIIAIGSDDYDLPAFNRAFITETLGMEIEATDDEGAVAEYREKQLQAENESRAKALKAHMVRWMYYELSGRATEKKYYHNTDYSPKLTNSVWEAGYQDLYEAYLYTYGTTPVSEEHFNQFAVSYAKAQNSEAQVTGVSDYLQLYVQSQISQELLMYHIFADAGLKVTNEEINEVFETKLEELIENAVKNDGDPEVYTREYFISQFGGETDWKTQIRRDLVYEKVGDYLLENNVTSLGASAK